MWGDLITFNDVSIAESNAKMDGSIINVQPS